MGGQRLAVGKLTVRCAAWLPLVGRLRPVMAPRVRFSQCIRRSVGGASPRQRQPHRCLSMGGASDTARVAALLTKGRVEGWLMNRYGGVGVRSLDTAAWIHDEMVRSPGRLGDHIGWKVGVDGADSALFPGEENPPGVRYCAPIFSASTVASGSTVTHARGGMRGVEVELGFVLGRLGCSGRFVAIAAELTHHHAGRYQIAIPLAPSRAIHGGGGVGRREHSRACARGMRIAFHLRGAARSGCCGLRQSPRARARKPSAEVTVPIAAWAQW